jgi:uncharacterized C2H2 Zn-finger protein
MTPNTSTLGRCPRCGAEITPGAVLITYDTDDGTNAFAECPECASVVDPE